MPVLAAGCVTHDTASNQTGFQMAAQTANTSPTRIIETRYDLRGYREVGNPAIRHEAHAVFRRTLVPTKADATESESRMVFAPASYSPLPASAELNAELAKQKAITAEMQEMRAAMEAAQTKMQAQYAQLMKQTGEALRLRDRLEAERNQTRANAATTPDRVAPTTDLRATQANW